MNCKQCDDLACVFKAVSDGTRVHICSLLSDGEICGGEILHGVNVSQPTLSYHMKLLCESGIVNARKDGSWTLYSINNQKLSEVEGFIKTLKGE